jgi:hypothetical protein
MAQFGDSGSHLFRMKGIGKLGTTQSQAAQDSGIADLPNYYKSSPRGYKSFWMNADQASSLPTIASAQGVQSTGAGYHLFSPRGRWIGRANTSSGADTELDKWDSRYIGGSKTGDWVTDTETFAQREERLRRGSTFGGKSYNMPSSWAPEKFRWKNAPEWDQGGYTPGEVASLIEGEFRPSQDSGNWAAGVEAYSESGSDVAGAEADIKASYGSLSEADIQTIIDKAKLFDPVQEGGWDVYKDRIASGDVTGQKETLGTLMTDWFRNARAEYSGYQGLERDIEGQEKSISQEKRGTADIMSGAREGLLAEAMKGQEQTYSSGFEGQGQGLASMLQKQDLVADSRSGLKDFQVGIGDMYDTLDTMKSDLSTAATGLGDMPASLDESFRDSQYEFGSQSGLTFDDWYDDLWDSIHTQSGLPMNW